jgi:ligand-binding sensor domain-containing protein
LDENTSSVLALVPDRRTGDLLVGTREGLMRLQHDRSTWLVRSSDFPVADVTTITQDAQGIIWCGFARGGLGRVADGKFSLFTRKDGIASETVQCLLSEPDGALWIGTADHGLYRYKNGRFTNLDTRHGLLDNAICQILDDGLGHFWLSTYHGLQRVAKDELNRCADGLTSRLAGQNYDHNDGLPIVEFAGGRQATG